MLGKYRANKAFFSWQKSADTGCFYLFIMMYSLKRRAPPMLSCDKSIFHHLILISYFLLTTSIPVSTSPPVLSSPVALLLFQAAYLGHSPSTQTPPGSAPLSLRVGVIHSPHVSDACSAQRSRDYLLTDPTAQREPRERRRRRVRTAPSPHAAFHTRALEDLLDRLHGQFEEGAGLN